MRYDGLDGGSSGKGVAGMGMRHGVLVDHGAHHVLADLVDGVVLRHGNGDLVLHGVGLLHDLVDGHLPLNGDRHIDLNVIGNLVHLELRGDPGDLGGDLGVDAAGSDDLPNCHGVSGSGALVGGGGGDGQAGGGSIGKHGLGKGHGALAVLGGLGNVAVSGPGVNSLAGYVVLVADLDLLGSNLDGPGSNDSVLDMVLGNGGASGDDVLLDVSLDGAGGVSDMLGGANSNGGSVAVGHGGVAVGGDGASVGASEDGGLELGGNE